jgi:hypothetical protein
VDAAGGDVGVLVGVACMMGAEGVAGALQALAEVATLPICRKRISGTQGC